MNDDSGFECFVFALFPCFFIYIFSHVLSYYIYNILAVSMQKWSENGKGWGAARKMC